MESYYKPTYYTSLLLTESHVLLCVCVQRKTLKQMHWKRTDVFTEQIFHAPFSAMYVCLFTEIGGIIQATDGKEPDYPYKSYLFKHWLERTIHFKGFSLVFFCAWNFYNLLQILIGLTSSSPLWGIFTPVYLPLPKSKRQPSLGVMPRESFHIERDEQGLRWTYPTIN